MRKKILLIGWCGEESRAHNDHGFSDIRENFEIIMANGFDEALSAIAEAKGENPITAIIFSICAVSGHHKKDKSNTAVLLVIDLAKKYYAKLKLFSFVADEDDHDGEKAAAPIGSTLVKNFHWELVLDILKGIN